MRRVIRTDGWTADWRLSSALWEAYSDGLKGAPAEGRAWVSRVPVAILCAGLPDDPIGGRAAEVADELKQYYPVVEGGTDAPLDPAAIESRVASYRRPEAGRRARAAVAGAARNGAPKTSGRPAGEPTDLPPSFVAVVNGRSADREEGCRLIVKSWVVSEEDDEEDPAADPDRTGFSVSGDAEITMLLAEETAEVAVDRVIDGFLRFFFKIGHDHTRFQRGR